MEPVRSLSRSALQESVQIEGSSTNIYSDSVKSQIGRWIYGYGGLSSYEAYLMRVMDNWAGRLNGLVELLDVSPVVAIAGSELDVKLRKKEELEKAWQEHHKRMLALTDKILAQFRQRLALLNDATIVQRAHIRGMIDRYDHLAKHHSPNSEAKRFYQSQSQKLQELDQEFAEYQENILKPMSETVNDPDVQVSEAQVEAMNETSAKGYRSLMKRMGSLVKRGTNYARNKAKCLCHACGSLGRTLHGHFTRSAGNDNGGKQPTHNPDENVPKPPRL